MQIAGEVPTHLQSTDKVHLSKAPTPKHSNRALRVVAVGLACLSPDCGCDRLQQASRRWIDSWMELRRLLLTLCGHPLSSHISFRGFSEIKAKNFNDETRKSLHCAVEGNGRPKTISENQTINVILCECETLIVANWR